MSIKRKLAAMLAAIMVMISFCSCDEQKSKSVSPASASSVPSASEPDPGLTQAQKDKIKNKFDTYLSENGLSAAVYAVYKGEELYSGGQGTASDDAPNSPEVVYGIASLTKQFTAASILQLYESGRLDINDKMSVYFPDYPHGDEITLKQLLCQRSGIPDYEVNTYQDKIIISCDGTYDKYAELDVKNTAEQNTAIIQSFFLSRDLLFTPGEYFDYSDSNYSLLASVIEQVSSESFHEYIRKHIFEPLEMKTASFIDDHEGLNADISQTDRLSFSMDYYTVKGAEFGCGDILASPKDLYQWYRGLFGGRVINENSLELMTENYSGSDELGYGFGLMIGHGKEKTIYHSGYIPSYYSMVIYLPKEDYFQALLANHADGEPQQSAAELAIYFGSVANIDIGF